MSTCCLVLVREVAERVRPPRTLFLRWPFGNPCGEPGNGAQQRRVVMDMLEAVNGLREPGTIVDLPYRWRREDWPDLKGLSLSPPSRPTNPP